MTWCFIIISRHQDIKGQTWWEIHSCRLWPLNDAQLVVIHVNKKKSTYIRDKDNGSAVTWAIFICKVITHQISTAKREGCYCVCSFSTLLFFDGFIWEKEILPKGYKKIAKSSNKIWRGEYLNILQLKESKMTEEKSHKGSSKGQKTWHVEFYEKEEWLHTP